LLTFGAAEHAWQVIAAWWFLLGPAMALTFYEPAFIAIDQWCTPDQRPKALAVLTVIGGLAGVVFIPGIEQLVALTGWRDTSTILGVLLLLVAGLTAAFALRGTAPMLDHDRPRARSGAWLRAVARDPKFLTYTAAIMLSLFAAQGVLAHRIARFSDGGFLVATVAGWAAAASALSLPGRWIAPLLAGRLRATSVQAATIGLVGVSTLLMIDGAETWQMVGHFVLFGLGFGALVPVRAMVMANWYSGPEYGRIMGIQASAIGVAGALGPAFVGIVRDRAGSYSAPMAALALTYFLAAGLVILSGARASSDPM
jgi:MFS family permease